jgi:hypothetical protein
MPSSVYQLIKTLSSGSLSILVLNRIHLRDYVDDILLCCPSVEVCKIATVALLTHLAEQGHKVNPCKVAVAQTSVTFLGHALSAAGKSLSEKE